MNKIKKLQQLIDRGKLLEENKTSRIVQMTIQKNGFNYYKDSNVFDVNHKVIFDYLFKSSYMPV